MLDKNNVTSYLLTKGWYQDYTRLEWWHLHNEPRQHPPPNRNDSDDQGPGDGVYGGVNYHDLLSSLLHNPVDEGSSDPTDDGPTDAPPSETDDFREKVKDCMLHYIQAVRILDCRS